jgi:hypothetical protein
MMKVDLKVFLNKIISSIKHKHYSLLFYSSFFIGIIIFDVNCDVLVDTQLVIQHIHTKLNPFVPCLQLFVVMLYLMSRVILKQGELLRVIDYHIKEQEDRSIYESKAIGTT